MKNMPSSLPDRLQFCTGYESLQGPMRYTSLSPSSTSSASTSGPTSRSAGSRSRVNFSGSVRVCGEMVGASFTSLTLMVTVPTPVRPPASVTVTCTVYESFASWFKHPDVKASAHATSTSWSPCSSNTPSPSPPVMAYVSTSPSSMSKPTSGAPTYGHTTGSPADAWLHCVFSSMSKDTSARVGFSFTSVTTTVTSAADCSCGKPLSFTRTSKEYVSLASWSSTAKRTSSWSGSLLLNANSCTLMCPAPVAKE